MNSLPRTAETITKPKTFPSVSELAHTRKTRQTARNLPKILGWYGACENRYRRWRRVLFTSIYGNRTTLFMLCVHRYVTSTRGYKQFIGGVPVLKPHPSIDPSIYGIYLSLGVVPSILENNKELAGAGKSFIGAVTEGVFCVSHFSLAMLLTEKRTQQFLQGFRFLAPNCQIK